MSYLSASIFAARVSYLPASIFAGAYEAIQACINGRQASAEIFALIATEVQPEWAIQACDNYGHGLEWFHEVDEDGKKIGELYANSKTGASELGRA